MRITKDATVNAVRDDSDLNCTIQKGKEQVKTPNAKHTTITTDQIFHSFARERRDKTRRGTKGVGVSQGRMGPKAVGEDAAGERRTGQK